MAVAKRQPDLEVLDLRHFSARELRPVLEEESQLWIDRLEWDYRGSADLLLQYLDSHVLPGYVAVHGGRVCGYAFCVYEGDKSVVGDVFVSRHMLEARNPAEAETLAVGLEDKLLSHLLETLEASPGMQRIEAQLLLHPAGLHSRIFRDRGFQIFPRLFLEKYLGELPRQPAREQAWNNRFLLRPWMDDDFNAAGTLIAEAYRGHLDSTINDQYQTVAGSLRFLHNIVRFPGCGIFEPEASFVITNRSSGILVALLLASRVSAEVAHVTQICVTGSLRHQGLGKVLLETCGEELRRRLFSSLTLTVTESNANALALYRRFGFTTRHRFDAMVWSRAVRKGLWGLIGE